MAVETSARGVRQYAAWLGAPAAEGTAPADDPRELGGKGASLARLVRLGFPVPPAFCLTTAAFDAHMAAIPDGAAVREALEALPSDAARSTITELVRTTPVPQLVIASLADALTQLAAAIPPELRDAGLAVRSSAVGEDSAGASFAGLHETVLGVARHDVPDAVRRCWASLWSAPAVAYRMRKGLPPDRVAMAVVVQALVPAAVAAVVFTRHPVTRRDDQLLITAVRGLGEPMVAGTVTPDTLVVDRASRAVVEVVPGDGGAALVVREGRVAETQTAVLGEPALSESEAAQLIELSLAVERAFAAAVDLEAAYAGGRWYLVQARPITTR